MPDLMMNTAIIAPSHASSDRPKIRYTAAATRVEADIIESISASAPEFMSESEFTCLPTLFTYSPRAIFTATPAATIIRAAVE